MRRWIIVRSLALVLAAVFVAQSAPEAQAFQEDRDDERRRGGSERDDDSRRNARAALMLPVAGTGALGETFTGTLSVQRFARRGDQIVAVGLISGTVVQGGVPFATLLNGPVELPVTASRGVSTGLAPSGATIRPVGNLSPAPPRGFMLVQAPPQACGVLHLELGAITLNVLGLTVTTTPITIDIAGETGGTNVLGALVCQILATLTNLTGLLGLLNLLLGVLGGLTGALLPGGQLPGLPL